MAATIGDIPEPSAAVPRYSQRAFPAYRFVPGVHPHPIRDRRGHSHSTQPTMHRHAPWQADAWRTLDDWLYGVDLFNARFFWEAHEAWEGLWAVSPRDRGPALLLQGLIQIAAALLKNHMRVAAGVAVLSREGLAKLRVACAEQPRLMGLDVADAIAAFEAYFGPAERGGLPALDQVPALRLD